MAQDELSVLSREVLRRVWDSLGEVLRNHSIEVTLSLSLDVSCWEVPTGYSEKAGHGAGHSGESG